MVIEPDLADTDAPRILQRRLETGMNRVIVSRRTVRMNTHQITYLVGQCERSLRRHGSVRRTITSIRWHRPHIHQFPSATCCGEHLTRRSEHAIELHPELCRLELIANRIIQRHEPLDARERRAGNRFGGIFAPEAGEVCMGVGNRRRYQRWNIGRHLGFLLFSVYKRKGIIQAGMLRRLPVHWIRFHIASLLPASTNLAPHQHAPMRAARATSQLSVAPIEDDQRK